MIRRSLTSARQALHSSPLSTCSQSPRWHFSVLHRPLPTFKPARSGDIPRQQNSHSFTGHRSRSTIPRAHDTIYALSTAPGKAGIAVIRVSGPSCLTIYNGLCPGTRVPRPRYAAVRTLCHPSSPDSNVLDAGALVLYLPGPKTVTGEDVLELHLHGGNATVRAVTSAIPLCATSGRIRYAEPGEFTKRAFLNDRLDLAQIEALSDTLSAETEQQRRAAVRGSSGSLGRTYEQWRGQLLLARGEIEALIDFSEDQHFDESPTELLNTVTEGVVDIIGKIRTHELASQRNELLRTGIQIALLGPPNVGKSSLMNQIVGREASIVSGEAGTTRDIVEAHLDIRGYLCTFADTAGFRSDDTSSLTPNEQLQNQVGAVEKEGIRRARAKAIESDVVVAIASIEPTVSGDHTIIFDAETLKLADEASEAILIINKRDAVPKERLTELLAQFQSSVLSGFEKLASLQPILISCKDAQAGSTMGSDPGGIESVANVLVSTFENMTALPPAMEDLHGVTERQRQLLVECRQHLEEYLEKAQGEPDETLVEADDFSQHNVTLAAEDLRYAANCLARITGRGESGDVEEVLGVIFEK